MVSKRPSRRAGHPSSRGATKLARRYRPALESFEERILLSLIVNSLTDTGTGSGFSGDLRYCITFANVGTNDTIDLTVPGTINLGSSLPALAENTTIENTSGGTVIINGGGSSSNYNALTINSGVTATISKLDFTNFNYSFNGGIFDDEGTLTLNSCALASSLAANGGAVYVGIQGVLTANQTTFVHNAANNVGGAIDDENIVTLTGGEVYQNVAAGYGGGIYDNNYLHATGVLIASNETASSGGGIHATGNSTLRLVDSTIASNNALLSGGGMVTGATSTLICDTIADNASGSGATGAGLYISNPNFQPVVYNTLIAQNQAGAAESDIDGPGSLDPASSYDLIGDTTVPGVTDGSGGNQVGTASAPLDAQLGLLQDNGGDSETIAPLAGSPALGAGDPPLAFDPVTGLPLPYDQRGIGYPRIKNGSIDIGAFQTQTASTDLAVSAASGTYGGTTTLTATLTSNGSPVVGETVDFHIGSNDVGTKITDVNGDATLTNVSLTGFNALTYTGGIAASFGGDSSYGSSNGTANLNVYQAPLTIIADSTSKTYGGTVILGGTRFTISPSTPLFNSDSVTGVTLTSAGAVATAAVAGSPYDITASAATGTGLANYDITYDVGHLTVDPALLTITADSMFKTYGDTVFLGGTRFTISPLTPLLNSDSIAGVVLTSAGAAATAGVAGSPYDITPIAAVGTGLDNYSITYDVGHLIVAPALLTITADSTSKTYGGTVTFAGTEFAVSPSTPLFNSDSVTGVTLTSTGAAANADVAGSPYDITASTATGSGLGNYSISYVNGGLTVDPALLTITANSTSKTYGGTVTFAGTEFAVSPSTPLFNSDSIAGVVLASAGAVATAGVAGSPYDITASAATGTGLDNYSITYDVGHLTVDPALLTITANSTSKTYGGTVTFAGTEFAVSPSTPLLNSDTVTGVTLTSTGAATTADVAGSPYGIVASAATGSGLGNYSISYVNGGLTVNPAPLTITVANQSKVYGQANPTLTGTVSGALNGDDVTASYATTATQSSDVQAGGYAITFEGLIGAKTGDYSVTGQTPGTLTVNPAPLTVTANAATKVYGQANPAFTASYSGFVLGQDPSALLGTLGFATAGTAASHVGSYPVTPNDLSSANYVITYAPGTLTVTPAPLTITAVGVIKTYGLAVPTLTADYSGFVNGDTAAGLATPVNLATAVTAATHFGVYPINASGATSADYAITFVDGAIAVTPNILTVTPVNQIISFGLKVPTIAATYSGFLNGDTPASLASPVSLSTTATAGSPVGVYAIAAGGAASADYTINYGPGAVAIIANPGGVAFLNSLYRNILGRNTETSGFIFWLNALADGTSESDVANQIYNSVEGKAARASHKVPFISESAAYRQALKAQSAALA